MGPHFLQSDGLARWCEVSKTLPDRQKTCKTSAATNKTSKLKWPCPTNLNPQSCSKETHTLFRNESVHGDPGSSPSELPCEDIEEEKACSASSLISNRPYYKPSPPNHGVCLLSPKEAGRLANVYRPVASATARRLLAGRFCRLQQACPRPCRVLTRDRQRHSSTKLTMRGRCVTPKDTENPRHSLFKYCKCHTVIYKNK